MKRIIGLLMVSQCMMLSMVNAADVEISDPFSFKNPEWELLEGYDNKGKAVFELGNPDAYDTDKITGKIGGAIQWRFTEHPIALISFKASIRIFVPEKVKQSTSGTLCFFGQQRLNIRAVLDRKNIMIQIEEGNVLDSVILPLYPYRNRPPAKRGIWYTLKTEQTDGKLMVKLWADDATEPGWQITRVETKSTYHGVGLKAYAQHLEFDDFYFKSGTAEAQEVMFIIKNPKPQPALEMLPTGEIMPTGWIKTQMEEDMTTGYYGNFDKFSSTVRYDLFGKGEKRYNGKKYSDTVGTNTRLVLHWWAGSSEGYWKDGMVRMAFMTGNEEWIAKANGWVQSVVEYAEANDGYIGTNGDQSLPGGRFNHDGRDNAELFNQSRMLTILLAYYGFTRDRQVLDAVIKAVDLTMAQNIDYFLMKTGGGGIPHGVGYFEPLKELYCLTGNSKYIDYTVKLFTQYNTNAIRFPGDDLQTKNLIDAAKKLDDHTPHIGEAAFVPHFIAMITETEEQRMAAANLLAKLAYSTNPSGSILGDETIKERAGSADMLYEHCAQMAMMGNFAHLMSLSGDMEVVDRIEKMMFNAIEGAWMSSKKGVVYCASDNVIEHHPTDHGGRLIYNASHRANCCALCAGRSLPHYVQSMWMKDARGVRALSYGPATLKTDIRGHIVQIEEITNYPFDNEVTFKVNPVNPVRFSITLRKPFGSNLNVSASKNAKVTDEGDVVRIEKEWRRGDSFKVSFDFKVKMVAVAESETVEGGGYYLQYGPLVFAKSFNHKEELVEDFGGGFGPFHSEPLDTIGWDYKIAAESVFTVQTQEGDAKDPWKKSPLVLEGTLIDKDGNKVKQTLVPMGTTTFRRVAFPVNK